MTQPPLPQAFAMRMETQLGGETPAYFAAMAQPPCRGLRRNPFKGQNLPLEELPSGLDGPIPWEDNGRYLALDSPAGLHPLQEAGAYYLQEPSAMIPARVLAPRPGEAVLDLCAAPGGKSTQLAAAMAGRGTLVANEPVLSRAQVLSRNLERMGVTNALVVRADPVSLAALWPQGFDAVLVDAPCSGEGMFRRHPETRLEWDANAPERCAIRQRRILESACELLKTGGRLCYSTCTLNPIENEETIAYLLERHPELEALAFSVKVGGGRELSSQAGCLTLYPHMVRGEGHFVALLQKTAPGAGDVTCPCGWLTPAQALCSPTRAAQEAWSALGATLSEAPLPRSNAALGETLLLAPPLPPLSGVPVLRAGLSLGQLRGKVFVPDHALAMAAPAFPISDIPLSLQEASVYLRGEALPATDASRGYRTVSLNGVALGFVKASDGWLKNHYPKGLRRP